MKLLISLFILSCLIFFSCSSQKQRLSVMTFNIRYDNPADGINRWEYRIPVVTAYMDSVAPDIVGMQEVLHNQIVDLQEMMPGYAYIGTGRDDGKQAGEYSPVFYRKDRFRLVNHSQFWLSETPGVPGSRSWDAAITRIVSWAELEDRKTGKNIFLFNTHFDHRGVQARLNSVNLISQKIKDIAGENPVILLGDFNIRKSSDDYDYMVDNFSANNGLTNAELVSRAPVKNAESTFNGFRTDIEPRVIDFIFVDNNFTVDFYRVDKVVTDGVFISDHWPVVSGLLYK